MPQQAEIERDPNLDLQELVPKLREAIDAGKLKDPGKRRVIYDGIVTTEKIAFSMLNPGERTPENEAQVLGKLYERIGLTPETRQQLEDELGVLITEEEAGEIAGAIGEKRAEIIEETNEAVRNERMGKLNDLAAEQAEKVRKTLQRQGLEEDQTREGTENFLLNVGYSEEEAGGIYEKLTAIVAPEVQPPPGLTEEDKQRLFQIKEAMNEGEDLTDKDLLFAVRHGFGVSGSGYQEQYEKAKERWDKIVAGTSLSSDQWTPELLREAYELGAVSEKGPIVSGWAENLVRKFINEGKREDWLVNKAKELGIEVPEEVKPVVFQQPEVKEPTEEEVNWLRRRLRKFIEGAKFTLDSIKKDKSGSLAATFLGVVTGGGRGALPGLAGGAAGAFFASMGLVPGVIAGGAAALGATWLINKVVGGRLHEFLDKTFTKLAERHEKTLAEQIKEEQDEGRKSELIKRLQENIELDKKGYFSLHAIGATGGYLATSIICGDIGRKWVESKGWSISKLLKKEEVFAGQEEIVSKPKESAPEIPKTGHEAVVGPQGEVIPLRPEAPEFSSLWDTKLEGKYLWSSLKQAVEAHAKAQGIPIYELNPGVTKADWVADAMWKAIAKETGGKIPTWAGKTVGEVLMEVSRDNPQAIELIKEGIRAANPGASLDTYFKFKALLGI